MISVVINTPDGEVHNKEYEYVVIKNQDGEFAILKGHTQIISSIDFGYIKLCKDEKDHFALILGGILEFHANELKILAQEAALASSKERASEYYEKKLTKRYEENRRKTVDYTKAEIELKKGIKAIGASKIK